jgi:SAM-dependent methyltransferase
MAEFDKADWERHWQQGPGAGPASMSGSTPNPYLAAELGDLAPGTALDAGCGAGAEAIWLAAAGWQVTAVDIASAALARAAERTAGPFAARVRWVEADLTVWDPGTRFDLVTTHYAHPATPQPEFYDRIASWVAPGGTLLIVGHRRTHDATGHGHGHRHPVEASTTAAAVTARLDESTWAIGTADEPVRSLHRGGGRVVPLHDVVVRAVRRR